MEIPKQQEVFVADGYKELKDNKDKAVLLIRDILDENDKLSEVIKGDLKLDPEFKNAKIKELSDVRMEVQETLNNLKFAMADKYQKEKAA